MEEKIIEVSKRFWKYLEQADVTGMESIADPGCMFVHIGVTCGMEEEMKAFSDGVFKPTEILLNKQEAKLWGDTAIVITDCNYGLLLGGKPTTHHFAVTEAYVQRENEWKLVQFSFTALVY